MAKTRVLLLEPQDSARLEADATVSWACNNAPCRMSAPDKKAMGFAWRSETRAKFRMVTGMSKSVGVDLVWEGQTGGGGKPTLVIYKGTRQDVEAALADPCVASILVVSDDEETRAWLEEDLGAIPVAVANPGPDTNPMNVQLVEGARQGDQGGGTPDRKDGPAFRLV